MTARAIGMNIEPDAAQRTLLQVEKDRVRLLGQALGEVLAKVGVIGSPALTGPELLCAAESFLASPAVEDERLDAAFLKSLGFTAGNRYPNGYTYMEFENGQSTITVSEPVDGEEEWCVGGERIPHTLMPETRADVLAIFVKIGIALPLSPAAETDIDGGPIAYCGTCSQRLTLVRPGKHQCDNPECESNK